jgi:hypothetical protein
MASIIILTYPSGGGGTGRMPSKLLHQKNTIKASIAMLSQNSDPYVVTEGDCACISKIYIYTNTQDVFYVVAITGFGRYQLTE